MALWRCGVVVIVVLAPSAQNSRHLCDTRWITKHAFTVEEEVDQVQCTHMLRYPAGRASGHETHPVSLSLVERPHGLLSLQSQNGAKKRRDDGRPIIKIGTKEGNDT